MYSDSLFPEFISKLNESINSGIYRYDQSGIDEMSKDLNGFYQDSTHSEFINDIKVWLKNQI